MQYLFPGASYDAEVITIHSPDEDQLEEPVPTELWTLILHNSAPRRISLFLAPWFLSLGNTIAYTICVVLSSHLTHDGILRMIFLVRFFCLQ